MPVTLWHLLVGMCSVSPIGTAYAFATRGGAGVGVRAGVVLMTTAIGLAFAWAMWKTGEIVYWRTRGLSDSAQEWCFRALYFAAAVWILLGGFVGAVLGQQVMRAFG